MPDCSLQMYTETKTFTFGDVSFGLMILKWNCLAIMSIGAFTGKREALISLETPSQLGSMWVACCGEALMQKEQVQRWLSK